MSPSLVLCGFFCLSLAITSASSVASGATLAQRLEELEAKYEAKISDLESRIQHNEQKCIKKTAELEQRNDRLEYANRKITAEVENLSRKIETLVSKEGLDDNGDSDQPMNLTHQAESIHRNHDGKPRQRRDDTTHPKRAVDDALQIAFTSYLDHDLDNLGPDQTLIFNGVLLNDGNAYNNYTGVFTAPVGGVYSFSFFVGERDLNEYRVYLVVNNQHQLDAVVDPVHDSQDLQGGNTANLRLNQGDAVYVTHQGGGTHVEGGDRLRITTFSGFLIYPAGESSVTASIIG